QHLERYWTEPQEYAVAKDADGPPQGTLNFEPRTSNIEYSRGQIEDALKVVICANPEAEAVLAAREILQHVRGGGRFRDATVLVRRLAGYHDAIQRVFSRYQIPFFMDRREPVSHHPLAELTRNALRTITCGWKHEDWFAALKTGLLPIVDGEVDRLENEALARGWKGTIWQKPIVIRDDAQLTAWLAAVHHRLLPPFQRLIMGLASAQDRPTGPELAAALRQFWSALRIEEKLQEWAESESLSADSRVSPSIHATVLEELEAWLENVE